MEEAFWLCDIGQHAKLKCLHTGSVTHHHQTLGIDRGDMDLGSLEQFLSMHALVIQQADLCEPVAHGQD